MTRYTIHSGDEFHGDSSYQVLRGPDEWECWITEPEDRNFYRDLKDVIERLELLEANKEGQRALIEQQATQIAMADHAYQLLAEAHEQQAKEIAKLHGALQNIFYLTCRMRRKDTTNEDLGHILRFCSDGGVTANFLRGNEHP